MNHIENINPAPRPIALSRLIRSPNNARRTAARAACEELKASILAHGLMQNLIVTDAGDGYYLVVAGSRRLAALNELKAEGKLPEDLAVPCQVVADERTLEISLAENAIRLAMHPADEFEAFAKLAWQGEPAAAIAARFGVSEKHVQQRLKLGNAAPELLQEYRGDKITLDVLTAFAISDDRDKQLQVYASLQDWQKDDPCEIRAILTGQMLEADSKLARFVGLDAYQAAGGATRTDLFGDEVYLENPDVLHALAGEKLKLIEQELKAEGWGWIEVSPERDWTVISACGRIHPQPVDVPHELLDQKAAIEAELEEIERALEDTESDASIDAQDEAQAKLAEIEEKLESLSAYDPEQRKAAGCYVSISHNGELSIQKGLVRRQDMKRQAAAGDAAERKPKGMPETLKRDLEAYRLQVAQAEIAKHPAIAFDLLAFSVACGVFDHVSPRDGVDVHFRQSHPKPSVEGDTAAAERLEATQLSLEWLKHDSEASRFNEFRDLSQEEKLAILAYCTALTLKPKLGAASDGEEATAYDIALSLTARDVAGYWRPTKANYLSRITRDQLLAIGREILGDPWAQSRWKDKKGELADQLDRAFAEPERHGHTPEQTEKLRRWLPAGMAFGAGRQPSHANEVTKAA